MLIKWTNIRKIRLDAKKLLVFIKRKKKIIDLVVRPVPRLPPEPGTLLGFSAREVWSCCQVTWGWRLCRTSSGPEVWGSLWTDSWLLQIPGPLGDHISPDRRCWWTSHESSAGGTHWNWAETHPSPRRGGSQRWSRASWAHEPAIYQVKVSFKK